MSSNSKAAQQQRQHLGIPSKRERSGGNRPTYETEADLRAEEAYAVDLEEVLEARLQKLSARHKIDFAALSLGTTVNGAPQVIGLVEVKCRYYPVWGVFPHIMVHAVKLGAGLEMAARMGVPFIIAQRDIHEDGGADYFCNVSTVPPADIKYAFTGRTDTEDPDDLGIRAFIPERFWNLTQRWST